jgi:hypothetical protein
MLTLFFVQILFIIACVWAGFLFYKYILSQDQDKPVIFYALSGLILITLITQLFVLFMPVSVYFTSGLLVGLACIGLFKRTDIKLLFQKILNEFSSLSLPARILFIIIWIIILNISAGPVIMDDSESYHIQSIKWMQEYGTVPGLVNLHERFGFNSSWFVCVASSNLIPGTAGGFTLFNSILSVWLSFAFISKISQFQREKNFHSAFAVMIIFIISLVIWPLLRGNAASTNYDFISTCVILVLSLEIFHSPNNKILPTTEWIIWPVFLFTVRVINFPYLILSLVALLFFIKQKRLKTIILAVVFCFLLIIPFLIRTVIIAGYPFYPITYFDWFNVDWKPDPQMTESLLEFIKYYNRVPTTYLEIEQTKALGSNWIPSWFHFLFLFDKILVAAGTAGLVLGAIILFIRKNFSNKNNILLLAVCFITLICWFIIAPDPRFVYGVLLYGIFFLVNNLMSIMKLPLSKNLVTAPVFFLLIGLSSYFFISKAVKQQAYRNWLLPAKLPQPPTQELIIDGIKFYIPEKINNNWNARCYGTNLPCLYKIDPRLKARGKNIRSGFHLEK